MDGSVYLVQSEKLFVRTAVGYVATGAQASHRLAQVFWLKGTRVAGTFHHVESWIFFFFVWKKMHEYSIVLLL